MGKKKVCKECKYVYTGDSCPNCMSTKTATTFQGRIYVIDNSKSDIAGKMGIHKSGEYAIKVR